MKVGTLRRILVLNRNHIGDCLLTTPLLRALKRRYPQARLCVSIPEANNDLLATNPHVDEIVFRPEINSWGAKFAFARQIRRQGYDLIISLQEKSNFYAWAARTSTLLNPRSVITIGLDHPRTRRHYQHNVPILAERHEVDKYLAIAELLGCPRDPNPVLELTPPPAARQRMGEWISFEGFDPDQRFIGINPGGTKADKRWLPERFGEVADRLHEELGLPAMILGGPGDREAAERIRAAVTTHQPLVSAGKASLGGTAALLERCRMLVTGDTGPMHMAVALAVPVVALFGPTDPAKFRPFSTSSRVLRHSAPCADCAERRPAPCLHTITAEEVAEAALTLPASRSRRSAASRRSRAASHE